MPVIDRTNKDALTGAIDIFLDEMRPFVTRCLARVPGRTEQAAIEQSLPSDKAVCFALNLRRNDDLESAIEVSFFQQLVRHYWEDVFSAWLSNDWGITDMLGAITDARNKVSHPPHLRDLELDYTLEHLNFIAKVLGAIGARQAQEAVSKKRTFLENPEEEIEEQERYLERLEEQFDNAVVALQEAEAWLTAVETDLKVANEELNKEVTTRKTAEEKAEDAQAALCRADEETQREMAARREAEEEAKAEADSRQKAELAAQASEAALKEEEGRTRSTSAELKIAEERIRELEKENQERSTSVQRVLSDTPFDRRSADYELWLIDEILSGRTSRSLLRQHAGDGQLGGRLVYFVNAAASDMTTTAWQGYVTNRQKALLRNGKNRTNPLDRQRSHGHLGLSH